MYQDDFLNLKLQERLEQNALRVLEYRQLEIDFCSNDYLGIARQHVNHIHAQAKIGSGGSRLLSGNYPEVEALEKAIATFHKTEAALIFNSGYDANVGLLSAVPQKGDTIIYDFLCHASLRDGIKLSPADAFAFLHNDLNDLERRLKHAKGNTFVVVESVYSMDGDIAPLHEILSVCRSFNAHLIVDEAHATGVLGERGEGLVQSFGLEDLVFARVHTFGKACGCHGAVVVGSNILKSFLVNFARSFIYSTSLPPVSIAAISFSYQTFPEMREERKQLNKLIHHFQQAQFPFQQLPSVTPIQVVIIEGNNRVKAVANYLQSHQLDVRPILWPTVPKGKERLRIVFHSYNQLKEVDLLIQLLQEIGAKMSLPKV